jgi:hypothetical protein
LRRGSGGKTRLGLIRQQRSDPTTIG